MSTPTTVNSNPGYAGNTPVMNQPNQPQLNQIAAAPQNSAVSVTGSIITPPPTPGTQPYNQQIAGTQVPTSGISSSAMVQGQQNVQTANASASSALTGYQPVSNPYLSSVYSSAQPPQQSVSPSNQNQTPSPYFPQNPYQSPVAPTQQPGEETQPTAPTGGSQTSSGSSSQTSSGSQQPTDQSQFNAGGLLQAASGQAANTVLSAATFTNNVAWANYNASMTQIGLQFDAQKAQTDTQYAAASQNLNFQASNAVGAAVGMEAQMGQFGGSTWNNAYSSKIAGYYAMAQTQMNQNWVAADQALSDNRISDYLSAQQNYNNILAQTNTSVAQTMSSLYTNYANGLITNYYQGANLGIAQGKLGVAQQQLNVNTANTFGGYTDSNGNWIPTVSGLNASTNEAREKVERANLDNTTTTLANTIGTQVTQIGTVVSGLSGLLTKGPNGTVTSNLPTSSTIGDDFLNFANKPGTTAPANESALFTALSSYAQLTGTSPQQLSTELQTVANGSPATQTAFIQGILNQMQPLYDQKKALVQGNANLAPYFGDVFSAGDSMFGTSNSNTSSLTPLTNSAGGGTGALNPNYANVYGSIGITTTP